jgi:hypothetical protein
MLRKSKLGVGLHVIAFNLIRLGNLLRPVMKPA